MTTRGVVEYERSSSWLKRSIRVSVVNPSFRLRTFKQDCATPEHARNVDYTIGVGPTTCVTSQDTCDLREIPTFTQSITKPSTSSELATVSTIRFGARGVLRSPPTLCASVFVRIGSSYDVPPASSAPGTTSTQLILFSGSERVVCS